MKNISYSKRKANKQHTCDWCGLPIIKGEIYNVSVNESEGELYTWKNHISCEQIATKLKMFEGVWNDGLCAEDFRDQIRDEYCSLGGESGRSFEYQLNYVKKHYL